MSDPPISLTNKQRNILIEIKKNKIIVFFNIESNEKEKVKHRGMDFTVEKYGCSFSRQNFNEDYFLECPKILIVL